MSKRDERPRAAGASLLEARWTTRLKSWVLHHRETAKESARRLVKTPWSTFTTCLVIGIALALPSGLYVVLKNVEILTAGWQGAAQITLYLRDAVSAEDGQKLAAEVGNRVTVATADYVAREQTLAEFREQSGFAEIIDSLDSNPLPAVITVVLADVPDLPKLSTKLLDELDQLEAVESAQLDLAWLQRLYQMMELGRRFAWVTAALLALGVVLVIGNTIRLTIESRRAEIVVVKLVGGTNAFVRRPFLYYGLWYGFGGALCASLVLTAAYYWLQAPLSELASLYANEAEFNGLGVRDTLLMWLSACVLGVLGAWLAVARHLGAIEPR
ncbi:MAG: permease-like cell division protein FtsX [Pseudomonadales bacterium]